MTVAIGIPPATTLGPDPATRRPRAGQDNSCAGQTPARSRPAQGGLEEALGHPLHSLGRRRRGRAALSGTLRLRAATEGRIVGLDDDGVTIRHKHRASGRWHTTSLSGHEFMRRFLQHVLPKGLHKVRYSGLWHHSRRDHAARARQLLALDRSEAPGPKQGAVNPAATGERLFRSIAVLGTAPLPVLQGWPPRLCAQALQTCSRRVANGRRRRRSAARSAARL